MISGEVSDPNPAEDGSFSASGRFQQPAQNHLNVSVKTDTLNIHGSSLAALERLAQHSPEIASKLIDSVESAETHDTRRYITGAITAGAVCIVMLACVTAIIIHQGFWAGIAFFLVCAATASIFSAIFTGKSLSLDWTVGLIHGNKSDKNSEENREE
jgi:hypothetical protein